MREKIYFEVKNSSGEIEKMELISKITLVKFHKDYIIYKNCDDMDVHYYVASYEDSNNSEFSNLNTDLSEAEKVALNKIFEAIMRGE